jgi:hypothetical protein
MGTGIGPILTRRLFQNHHQWPAVIGAAIAVCGACYVVVGLLPWTSTTAGIALICVFVVGHAASAGNWVHPGRMQQTAQQRPKGKRGPASHQETGRIRRLGTSQAPAETKWRCGTATYISNDRLDNAILHL